jgi:nitrite reductase/ring-hydroxylating ferredoxin subunit
VSQVDTFFPLERVENLRDGYVKTFVAAGRDLVLVQQGGVPAILEGICPHAGHPFSDSRLIGSDLRCDMHGYLFDAHSGICTYYTEGPCRGLRVYVHEQRNGMIGVLMQPVVME